ncbi:MAG TPA: isoprenylcysteine carboxylmethyltransferase family protein [Parvularculaceae bacterium]|nr:isoprenylcysteine carboxylmethyltransferase family protein [Parvularculaceae bacterium]
MREYDVLEKSEGSLDAVFLDRTDSMPQTNTDRLGQGLFFIRGLYIYAIIIISTAIVLTTRDAGPFESAALDRVWFGSAIATAAAGALFRALASGFAAYGTSGRVKRAPEAAELNTTGFYSLVRNPLYTGRIINYAGLAMLSGSIVFSAIALFASVLIYIRISSFEAAFLQSKFGEEYDRWAAATPMLMPRLTGWVKPKYGFWWKRMIWREQHKLFLLATGVFFAWFARYGFDIAQLSSAQMIWVYAYGAIIALRLSISGIGLTGYFKDLR